ncbi:hypothetical protein CALVIDRAFT_562538 [Calocera viscosa TUFC12733]|uniref:Uncharacterized protein n=1 Tax=Calocera viscosa (strain TUFC12733) TaxID=1330018 RepID=A0A167NWB7_CALVF|nr:hypothetical protein CALVIDRAFT_562538 [Calocera viscosa TUFC12733]
MTGQRPSTGASTVAKQFVLGGEVGPPEEGTVWSAKGRVRAEDKITDRTSVKNRVALHVPMRAPQDLLDMFHDQEYNLSQQIIAGEGGLKNVEQAMARSRDRRGFFNTWMEPSGHVIHLTTESLYTKHIGEARGERGGGAAADASAFATLVPSNRKKRRGRASSEESSAGEVGDMSMAKEAAQKEEDVYAAHGEGLDATYSLKVLPDHGGEQFRQTLARVKQQPFYRMDGTLTYQVQLVSMCEVDGSPYAEPREHASPQPALPRSAQSTPMRIQRGTEINLSKLLGAPSSPSPLQHANSETSSSTLLLSTPSSPHSRSDKGKSVMEQWSDVDMVEEGSSTGAADPLMPPSSPTPQPKEKKEKKEKEKKDAKKARN